MCIRLCQLFRSLIFMCISSRYVNASDCPGTQRCTQLAPTRNTVGALQKTCICGSTVDRRHLGLYGPTTAEKRQRRDSYGDLRPTACPDIDMTLRRAFSLLTHGFPFVQAAVSLLVNISVLDRASLNILYKSLADAQMCSTCQMCKTMHDAVHYWST